MASNLAVLPYLFGDGNSGSHATGPFRLNPHFLLDSTFEPAVAVLVKISFVSIFAVVIAGGIITLLSTRSEAVMERVEKWTEPKRFFLFFLASLVPGLLAFILHDAPPRNEEEREKMRIVQCINQSSYPLPQFTKDPLENLRVQILQGNHAAVGALVACGFLPPVQTTAKLALDAEELGQPGIANLLRNASIGNIP